MAKELENLQDPQYAKGLTADQIIHKLIMAEDELQTNKKVERYMKQASLRYDGAVFNNSMTEPDHGLRNDPFDTEHCRALFELLESREGKHPTVIISQFPVSVWYSMFREATYADACMDRILGCAVRIELKGESRRFHPEPSGRKEKSC